MIAEQKLEKPKGEIAAEIEILKSEHAALEQKLLELNRHTYLTPEERAEEARIKKQKLQKKDRIFSLQRSL